MSFHKWKGEFDNTAITLVLPTPIPIEGTHEIQVKIKIGALKIPFKTQVNFSTHDSDGVTMWCQYNNKDIVLWCDYLSESVIQGDYQNDFLSKTGQFTLKKKIENLSN